MKNAVIGQIPQFRSWRWIGLSEMYIPITNGKKQLQPDTLSVLHNKNNRNTTERHFSKIMAGQRNVICWNAWKWPPAKNSSVPCVCVCVSICMICLHSREREGENTYTIWKCLQNEHRNHFTSGYLVQCTWFRLPFPRLLRAFIEFHRLFRATIHFM